MCEDEVQLRLAAAVEKPSLFFGKMTAYIEDTSHSTRCRSRQATKQSSSSSWPRQPQTCTPSTGSGTGRSGRGRACSSEWRPTSATAGGAAARVLTCIGKGAALVAAKTSPAPMPTDAAAPHVAKLLMEQAAALAENEGAVWCVWLLGAHLDQWLLLATRLRRALRGRLFGRWQTPGLL